MANKQDWTGTSNSAFRIIGATGHSLDERESNDYYATPPRAVELLLQLENFDNNIWECAAGGEHIAKVLRKHGHSVWCTDIIDRTGNIEILDFLKSNISFDGDIITNPPYKYAQEFVEKALSSVTKGHKVAMLLKLSFLEGQKRQELFSMRSLKKVYVSVKRMGCAKNGKFADSDNEYESGAIAYAWFIWENGFVGDPIIKWFSK